MHNRTLGPYFGPHTSDIPPPPAGDVRLRKAEWGQHHLSVCLSVCLSSLLLGPRPCAGRAKQKRSVCWDGACRSVGPSIRLSIRDEPQREALRQRIISPTGEMMPICPSVCLSICLEAYLSEALRRHQVKVLGVLEHVR
jgi:hypothetical protein